MKKNAFFSTCVNYLPSRPVFISGESLAVLLTVIFYNKAEDRPVAVSHLNVKFPNFII